MNVVEWGIPESDGGAPLEGYKIAIRDTKKTMWIEIGQTESDVQKFNLKDLEEDHEYLLRIFAKNEIGFSDPLESDEPYKILHGTGKFIIRIECIEERISILSLIYILLFGI
jgi:hypothetical protein